MTAAAVGPLSRDEGLDLAAAEYARIIELLTGLPDEAWQRPTDCDEWDVREMVSHIVGMAPFAARPRETVRQLRAGRHTGRPVPDSINEIQVRERAGHSPAELIGELRAVAPSAVRARRRLPRPLRRVPLPADAGGSLDRLLTVVLTRDAWMHRVDLSRATGAPLLLTPDHDGRIIADVVADWAGQHGEPYDLVLTGPAGGRYAAGPAAEQREFDAIEFARILAGRASADGLPHTQVIF
jgi:uncharacterized protein (TIGR03083 family)